MDVLGPPYERHTIDLGTDDEGPVVATLIRRGAETPTRRAVLHVHGFADYFFHTEYAEWWTSRGYDFYALDLRKYGRSIRPHQTPNYVADLQEYYADLDLAWWRVVELKLSPDFVGDRMEIKHFIIGISKERADEFKLPVRYIGVGEKVDDLREFDVEAANLRGVIKAMDALFPGLGEHLEEETTVAIDGELYEIAYGQPVKPGAEVFFIPKIEGG